jgi:hypothetical protein
MRRAFFESYSRDLHLKIVGMGATFTDMVEDPQRLFPDHGYTTVDTTSVALFASEHRVMDIPTFLIRWFMRTLRDGYAIWVFRS